MMTFRMLSPWLLLVGVLESDLLLRLRVESLHLYLLLWKHLLAGRLDQPCLYQKNLVLWTPLPLPQGRMMILIVMKWTPVFL